MPAPGDRKNGAEGQRACPGHTPAGKPPAVCCRRPTGLQPACAAVTASGTPPARTTRLDPEVVGDLVGMRAEHRPRSRPHSRRPRSRWANNGANVRESARGCDGRESGGARGGHPQLQGDATNGGKAPHRGCRREANMTTHDIVTGSARPASPGGRTSLWQGMLAGRVRRAAHRRPGRRGVRPRRRALLTKIGALMAVSPAEVLPRVQARRMDLLPAGRAGGRPAGLGRRRRLSRSDPVRPPPSSVPATAGWATLLDQDDLLEEKGPHRISPLTVPMLMPNGPRRVGQPGVRCPGCAAGDSVSACAAGASACHLAAWLIRSGDADVVIAGWSRVRPSRPSPSPASPRPVPCPSATTKSAPRVLGRSTSTATGLSCWRRCQGVMILERADSRRRPRRPDSSAGWPASASPDAYHITGLDPTGAGQDPRHHRSGIQRRARPRRSTTSTADATSTGSPVISARRGHPAGARSRGRAHRT